METLIATSIVYMALENIVGANVTRRWIITFAFGLVHGFGFSFALRDSLQFAGSHMLTSLLSFNVGVELGQLAVLAVIVPVLNATFRYVVAERMGAIIRPRSWPAWHWMTERGAAAAPVSFPEIDAPMVLTMVRWAMALVAAAALIWIAGCCGGVVMKRRNLIIATIFLAAFAALSSTSLVLEQAVAAQNGGRRRVRRVSRWIRSGRSRCRTTGSWAPPSASGWTSAITSGSFIAARRR